MPEVERKMTIVFKNGSSSGLLYVRSLEGPDVGPACHLVFHGDVLNAVRQ